MLINELHPQMSLKTSLYVKTLNARASRAEKRDESAIHVYLSLFLCINNTDTTLHLQNLHVHGDHPQHRNW